MSIRIAEGLRILDAKVLQSVNPANQFDVFRNDEGPVVYMKFDFLDRGDGALIQVLHTGSYSSDLSVAGTIKGAGALRKRNIPHSKIYKQMSSLSTIAAFFCVPFLYLAFVLFVGRAETEQMAQQYVRFISSWGLILFIFIGYWGLAIMLSLFGRIPRGFELLHEED